MFGTSHPSLALRMIPLPRVESVRFARRSCTQLDSAPHSTRVS